MSQNGGLVQAMRTCLVVVLVALCVAGAVATNTLSPTDGSLFEASALTEPHHEEESCDKTGGSCCGKKACPLEKAVCCEGAKHCCPLGSQCMKTKADGPQLCGTGVRIPDPPGFKTQDPKCKCAHLCPGANGCAFCPCKRKVQNVVVMLPGDAGVPAAPPRELEFKPKGHRKPRMPTPY